MNLTREQLDAIQAMMLGGGSMSQFTQQPGGADQYQAMSVPQRLEMMQEGGMQNLSPADSTLLKLLRARREREANFLAPAAQAQLLGAPQATRYGNNIPSGVGDTFQRVANSLMQR